MSDDGQKAIGFIAGAILLVALVCGVAILDREVKKQIVKDAIKEMEAEKSKGSK